MPNVTRPGGTVRALARCRAGVALVEFAMILPIILLMLSYMLEIANYAAVRQQVSQLALQVADNASRIGGEEVLRNRPITERQINDLLVGARLQAGNLDLQNNGRVILSSLETNSDDGQWLHWQRCFGDLPHESTYGQEGDGISGKEFTGMGPSNGRITASAGNPVMFVEIRFRYTPLIYKAWAPAEEFTETAALSVRDDRDTSRVYNSDHVDVSTCR